MDLSGPFLVLAPKSTLTNWMRELGNWAPQLKAILFHGDKDERARLIADELQVRAAAARRHDHTTRRRATQPSEP
jgi:SNF2 family DNA or RNA helicase